MKLETHADILLCEYKSGNLPIKNIWYFLKKTIFSFFNLNLNMKLMNFVYTGDGGSISKEFVHFNYN